MLYFKKERVSNPIKINGKAIPWETAGIDTGVRQFHETNDKEIVDVLNGFADRRKMGVVRISPQIYESLKKKPTKVPAPQPPGFGPEGPVRALNKESVLIKPRERAPSPGPAAPAVIEVSPPPPQRSFRAPPQAIPIRAVPAPEPQPATPAIPTEEAQPLTPKPVKRTRAKKSAVQAAVESLREE